jgi:hypothetical protein
MPGAASPAPHDDAAVVSLFPTVPDVLEFESWWTERQEKRYMLVLFFPALDQVQVLVDDSKVPITITVNDRAGRPLKAWDFYVGATIDILGRSTTLMTATMRTVTWVDGNARRLWKVKEAVETKLNKFRVTPHTALDYGMFKVLTAKRGSGCLGGVVNIGKLARTVNALEAELSEFQ